MRFLLLATALLASLAAAGRAQSAAAVGIDPEAIDRLASRVRTAQGIPALALAIGLNGEIVYDRAFGLADVENDVAATPLTRFRTASIAKPMTAVAVMQLVERGTLDLDAAICDLVEEWPKKRWAVRVRDLLAHLGGVRHYNRPREATGTRHYRSLAASVKLFAKDPLVAEPRTRFRYTTYGYTLLGRAIEVASGQRYRDYMRARVWGPAGMTGTSIDDTLRLIPHRARGYQRAPGSVAAQPSVIPAALHDTSMKIPGGGIRSTASDLVRFAHGVLDGTLVRPGTRDRMFTAQRLASGEAIRYGLGFGVGAEDGNAMISHSGGQAGTSCLLQIVPHRKLVVAAMTNLRGAKLGALMRDIRRTVGDR